MVDFTILKPLQPEFGSQVITDRGDITAFAEEDVLVNGAAIEVHLIYYRSFGEILLHRGLEFNRSPENNKAEVSTLRTLRMQHLLSFRPRTALLFITT